MAEVDVAEKELAIARKRIELNRQELQRILHEGKLHTRAQEVEQLQAELKTVKGTLSACNKLKKPEQGTSNDIKEGPSIDEPKTMIAKIRQRDMKRCLCTICPVA